MNPFDLVDAADVDGLRKYISHGGKLDIQDPDTGQSLLATAVWNRNREIAGLLVQAGCNPDFKRTVFVPLILAAGFEEGDIVEQLINAGANVNIKGEDGETALMAAAATGNTSIVKRLLDAGVNPRQRDLSGRTALSYAAEKNHTEVCELLLPLTTAEDRKQALSMLSLPSNQYDPEDVAELIRMAGVGGLSVVKDWIENEGLPVDSIDGDGNTPLMMAANGGYLRIVEYLVSKGADVNLKNFDGECALMFAADGCQAATYDYLYPLTEKRLRKRAEKIKQEEIACGNWARRNAES